MDANVKGNFMENRGWDQGFSSISRILAPDLFLISLKMIPQNNKKLIIQGLKRCYRLPSTWEASGSASVSECVVLGMACHYPGSACRQSGPGTAGSNRVRSYAPEGSDDAKGVSPCWHQQMLISTVLILSYRRCYRHRYRLSPASSDLMSLTVSRNNK